MIAFQFVANLVIAEALQIRLEPQQQTVSLMLILFFVILLMLPFR